MTSIRLYFLADDKGTATEHEIATSQTSFTETVPQLEVETLPKKENQELIAEMEDLKTKNACPAGANVAVCDVKNGAEQYGHT